MPIAIYTIFYFYSFYIPCELWKAIRFVSSIICKK